MFVSMLGVLLSSSSASAQYFNPYQVEMMRQAAIQAELQRQAAIRAELQRRAAIQAELQRQAIQAELQRQAAIQAERQRWSGHSIDDDGSPRALDGVTRPVPTILAPINDIGMVPGTRDRIYMNPAVCANVGSGVCTFFHAHEQGHIEWGADERMSDCYAARNAPASAVYAAIAYFRSNPGQGDYSHGSFAERASIAAKCFADRAYADQLLRAAPVEDDDAASQRLTRACLAEAREEAKSCRETCNEIYGGSDWLSERVACRRECKSEHSAARQSCSE